MEIKQAITKIQSISEKIKQQQEDRIKELINQQTSDLIILQNIKKYMIGGELKLSTLNSKQRSYLHQLCGKYNMEHYSMGNYNNRVLVLNDKSHTFFNKDLLGNIMNVSKMNITKKIVDELNTENECEEHIDCNNEHEEYDEEEEDDEETSESSESSESNENNTCNRKINYMRHFSIGEKTIYCLGLFNVVLNTLILAKLINKC